MKASWLIPLTFALVPVVIPATASAVNIYPIDRATMLTGGKFDFKVEFDKQVDPAQVSIKINGKAYQQVWDQKSEFIKDEDGLNASSLVIKNVDITTPGDYKVEVSAGDEKGSVSWNVYQTPEKRQAKNVILFIGDGLSVAHRTAARVMSKGITEGKANGRLAIDDLTNMAFIGTSSTDSIAADSANTMSAYMTGHKSGVNALGVYVSRAKDSLNHPKQETLGELIKRTTGMSVGIVSDAELEDATPAAVLSHTRRRADKAEIVSMFYDVKPDVLLGGGSAYFLPETTSGSKRKDNQNYVERFQQAGYQLVTNADELKKQGSGADKLLGLFHTGNMDDVLDRRFLKNDVTKKFPDQPDLTEMTQTALDVLSKNQDGFFLMVESALIDKASHPLDWERAAYNTIMLDQSVAIAKKFAETHPDTLIIVTGDHTHGISIVGTVDDDKPGNDMREKVGVYETAGYPNYEDKNGDGYPDRVDVSKRLAVFFNNFPDHYETFRPKLDARFVPAIQNEKGEYIANAIYKDIPGAVLRTGNIPRNTDTGVHSVDDMIVQASGPGAERIHGYMDNTELFRVIVDSLSLGHGKQG
ncbi:alkaline phosphatase [Budviciaceae bacterium CWB-B4]|uniref:Alkaline phosphatase n=1 Tax=Limnobaculum xujianqingii TaxID=2738837 RepID=A0A9D7AJQ5_9GAMM|nr:alkaline phosphatase [Limnobaculum xujianqingii]MBK5073974.1 alkaline phosphatase [Limnobaculum xujianqingii]MBK5177132.1 alkaline phosphatase [Limnobaculum xujianqingii]